MKPRELNYTKRYTTGDKHEIFKNKLASSGINLQRILEKFKYYLEFEEYVTTITILLLPIMFC